MEFAGFSRLQVKVWVLRASGLDFGLGFRAKGFGDQGLSLDPKAQTQRKASVQPLLPRYEMSHSLKS